MVDSKDITYKMIHESRMVKERMIKHLEQDHSADNLCLLRLNMLTRSTPNL